MSSLFSMNIFALPVHATPSVSIIYTQAKTQHCSDISSGSFGPIQEVAPQDCVLQQVQLHNQGLTPVHDVKLVIPVPAGVTAIPFQQGQWLKSQSTLTPVFEQNGQGFVVRFAELAPQSQETLWVKFQVN